MATAVPPGERKPRPVPPGHLVIGYSHDPAGSKVRNAITSGVNVVCWSFVHFDLDGETKSPIIRTDLDLDAIRSVRNHGGWEDVLHVAAVGGWNAPHPPPGPTAADWAEAFADFNAREGNAFDGLDWDLEGHDDRDGPTSRFSIETLNMMADVSVLLKERYGLSVSMAPAESYLDSLAEDDAFSLDLNLPPRPWDEVDPDAPTADGFAHAGRQCYARVLHRAGSRTFDWVSIQLYEKFSRFLHESTVGARRRGTEPTNAQVEGVTARTVKFFDGFRVDLGPPYGRTRISVDPDRLVYGFANGWADGEKFVKVEEKALRQIFRRLKIRGAMFWTIEEEGTAGIHMADMITRAIRASIDDEEEDFDDDDYDDDDNIRDGKSPDRDEL